MRTANPAFSNSMFNDYRGGAMRFQSADTMTTQGAVNKTAMLLGFAFIAAIFTWNLTAANPALSQPIAFGGAIGGFIVAMVTIFKKEWAGITAPVYAALEGLFLGAVSVVVEMMYPGIALQAVLLTFGTLFAMLTAYTTGLIKVTEKLRWGIVAATGAICLTYVASMILGFFNIGIPFLHDASPIGIGISLLIVGVAAFNLLLDFDFIERGAAQGLPKFMEWYGAFGLMVTLVWLYMELLRLLMKMRSSNR